MGFSNTLYGDVPQFSKENYADNDEDDDDDDGAGDDDGADDDNGADDDDDADDDDGVLVRGATFDVG